MKRERARLVFSLLMAGLFFVPLLMESAQAVATSTPAEQCAGHPRNTAGFVTDGSPQCGTQWCVGPNPGYFACLVAVYPQLPEYLHELWVADHPVQVASTAYTNHGPRNSREQCIFDVENPHDPSGSRYGRSTNPSHFGAFQFAYSTWVAHGGNPNTWGNASPNEQWQVFYNTVAANGYSDWAPYDGC